MYVVYYVAADIFKTENTINKYVKTHCFLSTLSEVVFYITWEKMILFQGNV